jgi:benzoyl-CoA reductase/2-hydroxyglutaryl-CoA dehydratase subunit BcrC/BadD/HgdB
MSGIFKGIDKIREALTRRPAELASARATGQKVLGWIGYNVPEEVIYACGLIPVRIIQGGDSRLAEIGANYISTQNCFFLRQCIGLFAEKSDPYVNQVDAVVTDTTCLQLHRMGSLLRYYFQVKVLQLGIPKDPSRPEARSYFASEVKHLIEQLQEVAGYPLDDQRLEAAIDLYQKIRECQRELYRRAASEGDTLSWREVFEIVQAGFLLDRAEYLALLQELLGELPGNVDKHTPQPVRVFLVGSAMAPGDTKHIDLIESAGAEIVGDLLWSSYASIADLDVKTRSLQGLIDAYLDRFPHAGLPHMEIDTDRRLSTLAEQVQERRAHAVIYYSLRYCDPFSFKMLCTKDYLRRSGVSLMEVQTDYGAMDTETLRTRLEAFLEMLTIRM